MEPEIRKADLKDASEILSLQLNAYQSEADLYQDPELPPLKQTLAGIEQEMGEMVFLKVVRDQQVIGSVRGRQEGDTCYIGKLIVHPEFQNQGLGRRLMTAVEETFSGVKRFELFTGHKSEKNIHFYNKLGYRRFKDERVSEGLVLVFLEKQAG